jgi:hypothetical protein
MKTDSYSFKKQKNNRKRQNFDYYEEGADQHHVRNKIRSEHSKKANNMIDRIIRSKDVSVFKDLDDYS